MKREMAALKKQHLEKPRGCPVDATCCSQTQDNGDLNSYPAPSTGGTERCCFSRTNHGPKLQEKHAWPQRQSQPCHPLPLPLPLCSSPSASITEQRTGSSWTKFVLYEFVFHFTNSSSVANCPSCRFLHWNTNIASKRSSIYPSRGKATVLFWCANTLTALLKRENPWKASA